MGTSRNDLDTPGKQLRAAKMLPQSLIKGIKNRSRNKGLREPKSGALRQEDCKNGHERQCKLPRRRGVHSRPLPRGNPWYRSLLLIKNCVEYEILLIIIQDSLVQFRKKSYINQNPLMLHWNYFPIYLYISISTYKS